MTQNVTLSANQTRALSALLTCRTIAECSEQCHLSARTIFRYLSDPAFQAELARAEGAMIDAAIAALSGELSVSVATLATLRDSPKTSDATRLRSSLALVDILLRLQELQTIQRRLERLEEMLHARYNSQAQPTRE